MFDDFDVQQQSDEIAPEEINPQEYDDWLLWCLLGMYQND